MTRLGSLSHLPSEGQMCPKGKCIHRANLSEEQDASKENVSGANILGAIVSGANVSAANVSGANVSGANEQETNGIGHL